MHANASSDGFLNSPLKIFGLLLASILFSAACVVVMQGPGLVAALFSLIGVHYVVWGRALTNSLRAERAKLDQEDLQS